MKAYHEIQKFDQRSLRLLMCRVAERLASKVQDGGTLLEIIEIGRKLAAGEEVDLATEHTAMEMLLFKYGPKLTDLKGIQACAWWCTERCTWPEIDAESVWAVILTATRKTDLTEEAVMEMLDEVYQS